MGIHFFTAPFLLPRDGEGGAHIGRRSRLLLLPCRASAVYFRYFFPSFHVRASDCWSRKKWKARMGCRSQKAFLMGASACQPSASFFVGVYASCLACSPLARNAPKSASRIILKMPFLLFTIITSIRIIAKGRALGKVW